MTIYIIDDKAIHTKPNYLGPFHTNKINCETVKDREYVDLVPLALRQERC